MTTAIGYALLTTFTVLLSYTSLSHGLLQDPRRISHGLSASGKYLTRDELWFNQTLDHFSPYVKINHLDSSIWLKLETFFFDCLVFFFFFCLCPQDHRKFGQRYYEYLDHLRVPDGPIFLMICGEGPCNGIPNDYLSV